VPLSWKHLPVEFVWPSSVAALTHAPASKVYAAYADGLQKGTRSKRHDREWNHDVHHLPYKPPAAIEQIEQWLASK
jgi:hypothetical protein